MFDGSLDDGFTFFYDSKTQVGEYLIDNWVIFDKYFTALDVDMQQEVLPSRRQCLARRWPTTSAHKEEARVTTLGLLIYCGHWSNTMRAHESRRQVMALMKQLFYDDFAVRPWQLR